MTSALGRLHDLASEVAVVPTRWRCRVPWQAAYLADPSAFRLVRACNQVGKTTTVCDEIVDLIRGEHVRGRPWTGPINVTLISESIEQMAQEGAILEKLWEVLPKHEIDPEVWFERGRGLRGVKYPAIRFVNGPGSGSVIRLRTYNQGPEALAGATIHAVYCDEPCPENVYSELAPRLLRHAGWFTITFTPVPGMPDQGWLRSLVEKGIFSEHHVTMKPENAHPEGYARPLLSQAQIDRFRDSLPAGHAAMRCEAAWEAVSTERYVSAFDDGRHVREFTLSQIVAECARLYLPPARLVVGIDHGLVPGKQRAALVAVAAHPEPERRTSSCRVWHVDEVAVPDQTTPDIDAANILAMLARHGLTYEHVDAWIGDRSTGIGRNMTAKDNGTLRIHLLKKAQIPSTDPRCKLIFWPRKGTGSVAHGAHLLNTLFAEDRALVHPRCVEFRASLLGFKGDTRYPKKDVWDAHRYAVEQELKSTFVAGLRRATMA